MLGKTVRVPRHVELSEPGWRRAGPSLTSSFSPKLVLRCWKKDRAVQGLKATGNDYSPVPYLHITLGTLNNATFLLRKASEPFIFW